jgi:hypothetical protein
VSFSIQSGPATIVGSTVHLTGAGLVTVQASQAGDSNYNAAPNVSQSFTVAKATPIITWSNPADIVYGTLLSGTQLNAAANVTGSFNYTPAAGTLLNAGSNQTLHTSFTPADTANYNSATKDVLINVIRAMPQFSNLSAPTVECGTVSINLSGKLSLGALTPTGSVTITLNSVSQGAVIQAGGVFSSSFATASLVPANSPYSVTFSYPGDANFLPTIGTSMVTVIDTTAPVITLSATPISFWPPNGSMHLLKVTDLVTSAGDSCDPTVNTSKVLIASVSSDEGKPSGGDIVISQDCRSVQLRADRNGNGDGRVYTINLQVRDVYGNTGTASFKVTVPHDQGKGQAVDSGPAYTVLSGCP